MFTKRVKKNAKLSINGIDYPAGSVHTFTELQCQQYAAYLVDLDDKEEDEEKKTAKPK